MARARLVDKALDQLMEAIAAGTFPPGSALPKEAELATYLDVSRPTMREVVQILAERGVLSVRHGRGTFVTPLADWDDIDSLVIVLSREMSSKQVGLHLVEIRRMIEVGSAGHAAVRATDDDLSAMQDALEKYATASARGNATAAARADVEFHHLILKAARNPFVTAVMRPLTKALLESRILTSELPEVRDRAALHHARIFEAIQAHDAEAAKNAMRAHMTQTATDINQHLR